MKLAHGLCLATCLSPSLALGLPEGGVVSGGAVTLGQATASQLAITQASDRAVIDWSSFNIGAGERVDIRQPSAASVLLNRIHDAQPSQIFGALSANGQVILSNPNGMLFGPSAQVDVGGLVATSTRFAETQSFLAGGALAGQPGQPGAAIFNQGSLTAAQGGLIALVAPGVQNDGLIVAKAGRVTLAGADTLSYDLYGDGLVSFAASGAQPAAYAGNTGTLKGAQVVLSAAQAAQVVDSAVNLSGVVDASSLESLGGTVRVTGDHIALSGRIDASGETGGGVVQVGGEWQGSGTTPWAQTISMDEWASIDASAKRRGSGGEAVLWSRDSTTVAGTIHAKGGAQGGDGGRIETSGLQVLNVAATAMADASAANGQAGLWLLDPNNITIHETLANANVAGAPNYVTTADSGRILDDNIRTALNGGTSVIITTGTAGLNSQAGDISTSGNVDLSTNSATDVTLTLRAHRNITLNNTTATASGAGRMNLVLWANFDGDASAGRVNLTNSNITTNGGDVHIAGGLDDGSNGGVAADGRPDGYSTGISGAVSGVSISGSDISTGAGSILIRGQGFDSIANSQHGIVLQSGASLLTTSGNISLRGIGGKGVTSNTGIRLLGNACAGGCTEIVTDSGTVSLHGTGGADQDLDGAGPDTKDGNSSNSGIFLDNFAQINTLGTGAINLTGIGADGIIDNQGILLQSGAVITSAAAGVGAGTITLNGTAGSGVNQNRGIWLTGNGCAGGINCTSITTNGGNISLTGVGGADQDTDGAGPDIKQGTTTNDGIVLSNFSRITSSGTGSITLDGTGANGTTGNMGMRLVSGGAIKSTGTGAINLTGRGGEAISSNYGIFLQGNNCSAGADCTEVTSVTGNITLTGFGRADQDTDGAGSDLKEGTLANPGIQLRDAAQIITNGSGNILLTGTGASGTTENQGIILLTGASIESTASGPSAGTITLNGTGGNGTMDNIGVYLTGNDCTGGVNCTEIVSVDGDIIINGVGQGSDGNNFGLLMERNARILSLGTTADAAAITLSGTGANGTSTGSRGFLNYTSLVESTAGNISITGNAGTGGTGDFGLAIAADGVIRSLGTSPLAGNITLTGSGSGNYSGVRIDNSSQDTLISTVGGNILLDGTAEAGKSAVDLLNGAVVVSQNGNTTLRGAKMSVMSPGNLIGGAGATGSVTFDGALDGQNGNPHDSSNSSGDLTIQTSGAVNFTGVAGGNYSLGQVSINGASGLSAGVFNTGNFIYTGTGPVAFTGSGLNSAGNVNITTDGNITGSYAGNSGRLYAGTGSINATVSFNSLDISAATATLSGTVGPGGSSQEMADRIMVNGSRGPATAAFRFGTYDIGVNAPATIVSLPQLPADRNIPAPPTVNPVDPLPPNDIPVVVTPPFVDRPLNSESILPQSVARASNHASDTRFSEKVLGRGVGNSETTYLIQSESDNLDAQYYGLSDEDRSSRSWPSRSRLFQVIE